MEITEQKTVHSQHWDPAGVQLFVKSKANDRAQVKEVDCTCPDCPLLASKQCLMVGAFVSSRCPYGKWRSQTGPTKRSGKTGTWIRENTTKDVPWLKPAANKMAFIGDWVYLPYAHMTMCEEVPFLSHSKGFGSGTCLLSRENWIVDNVVKLVLFRPLALFGGEIPQYQREQVPLFMTHLYRQDRAMWDAVVARVPHLNKPPNYIGRKALLRTLIAPFSFGPKDHRYPVVWHWDGENLTTESADAYSSTWGGVKPGSLKLEVVPAEDEAVVVQHESWVSDETVFVD